MNSRTHGVKARWRGQAILLRALRASARIKNILLKAEGI
jgi:hypothetical protein